ncbi:MAG: LysM peptidoglycan-binding domain-containing protein [Pseudomonadota bacterium]|nr:MAG: LysM peptidoglycan-binding domain-containing protein [Pseudomonadota bacterium]
MINNKLSGFEVARVLLIAASVAFVGCASKPKQQPAPEPQPAVRDVPVSTPLPEPEPVTASALKPGHPERYTVQRGDTLWDISTRFLNDPWLWPEVWHINPEIRNPHLIYPGDVVVLYFKDGRPYLTLEGAEAAPAGIRTDKISPEVRYEEIQKAIPTIPREAIAAFLTRPLVSSEDELDAAPYVVSSYEDHLVVGTGGKIYVRQMSDKASGAYQVVRKGDEYRDPVTDELLGVAALHVADAALLSTGDPASLRITDAKQEVMIGDNLLPFEEEQVQFNFQPHAPKAPIQGHIISAFNALSQIGQFQVVVLNRGERDGVEVGHVMAISKGGRRQRDPFKRDFYTTPNERAGLLMVFRTFNKVSFALVLEAYRSLEVYDMVGNP